jgi:hypothetical protein
MLPEMLPAAVGVNVAVNDVFAPAVNVSGKLSPLRLYPVPDAAACEMVTLALPEFDSVIVCELLLPTTTLPKATLVGFAVSEELAATPVPVRGIVVGEPGALLVSEMLPLALPAAVGANRAVNVAFCPAAIASGRDNPLMLNPVPDGLACVIVRFPVPRLSSVMVCDAVLPVVTFPKLTLEGVAVICGCTPVPLTAIVNEGSDALLVI